MAIVERNIDAVLSVFRKSNPKAVGSRSRYSSIAHPATGKLIEGWQWDQRLWPTLKELEAAAYVPSLWDPQISGVSKTDYQSGYGDNNDILLLSLDNVTRSGIHHWAPEVQHGYFYSGNEEWYFYSDMFASDFFAESTVSGSNQVLDLTFEPKDTIPISVRMYRWNGADSKYQINTEARKKVDFTVSGTKAEFIVVSGYEPARLELNGVWTKQVGGPVSTVSGNTVIADINALEFVGLSDGTVDQEFQMEYFPTDRSQAVEVWTWGNASAATQWTILSGLQTFTGTNQEVYLDYDVGTIHFGNYDTLTSTGAGMPPPISHKVGVYYTAGLVAHYEPNNTRDYTIALNDNSNTNPIHSAISTGFLQINAELIEPASITLSADLPKVNPYLIDIGNNTGELIATVLTKNGTPVEGQEVFFEILTPVLGSFDTSSTTTTAWSATAGQAKTLYRAPLTASDVGKATTEIYRIGSDTVIYVDGLSDPGNVKRLFTYQIHDDDPVLGIPSSGLSTYYTDYLADQGIVSGTQATENYETDFRTAHSISTPVTFDSDDISTGRKTILLEVKAASQKVVDPNTGDLDSAAAPVDVFSPLYPSTVEDVSTLSSTRLKVTYENQALTLPTVSGIKSYFLIGDANTRIRAYAINPRTNQRVYSNTIEMKAQISDKMAGAYLVDDLNDLSSTVVSGLLKKPRDVTALSDANILLTSGVDTFYDEYLEERLYSGVSESYVDWFKRTRKGDSVGLAAADAALSEIYGLEDLTLVAGEDVEIPLGFRVRSAGITVASLMDQVTFVTPNDPLPSGYFPLE